MSRNDFDYFYDFYDLMGNMTPETRKFFISLLNTSGMINRETASVKHTPSFDDDRYTVGIRSEDENGDIISQDILEFSVSDNIATIRLLCRQFKYKGHSVETMYIIDKLRTNSLTSKMDKDYFNYDIIDKGFDIITLIPRIPPNGIMYKIVTLSQDKVDEEVAKFSESHDVIDVNVSEGEMDYLRKVVIRYKLNPLSLI